MKPYTPTDWYWRRDNGAIFSSARASTVPKTDTDFTTWVEVGGVPTRWPEDEAGNQTDAALQAVLAPYGVFVDLDALKDNLKAGIDDAAEAARLRHITGGAGQAMTYARKVEQARAVLAAADPQPADYPMLAASIGIDGADIVRVAETVLAMDAAWGQIGAAIEAARLAAKSAVNQSETAETAREAALVDWP